MTFIARRGGRGVRSGAPGPAARPACRRPAVGPPPAAGPPPADCLPGCPATTPRAGGC